MSKYDDKTEPVLSISIELLKMLVENAVDVLDSVQWWGELNITSHKLYEFEQYTEFDEYEHLLPELECTTHINVYIQTNGDNDDLLFMVDASTDWDAEDLSGYGYKFFTDVKSVKDYVYRFFNIFPTNDINQDRICIDTEQYNKFMLIMDNLSI